MEQETVRDIEVKITEDTLLRKLRITDGPQDEDHQKVVRMLQEALACARPKYTYGIAAIEQRGEDFVVADGHRIVSPLVRRNLDKTHRIFPYLATCGREAEHWSHQYTDMIEHFWADEIKIMILHQCIMAMHKTVKDNYFPVRDMSQMSPGSLPAWPITEQTVLFGLIGQAADDIGVTLTDSFLMIPSKSVSGFYFSSEVHFENCQLCPMPNCPNRRTKDVSDNKCAI